MSDKGKLSPAAVGVPYESPLPLPMGEVAERSEDGEGILGCKALSVTYGDSSPKGRAKGVYAFWREKWSVSVPIRSIRCFMTAHQSGGTIFCLRISLYGKINHQGALPLRKFVIQYTLRFRLLRGSPCEANRQKISLELYGVGLCHSLHGNAVCHAYQPIRAVR